MGLTVDLRFYGLVNELCDGKINQARKQAMTGCDHPTFMSSLTSIAL